LGILFQPDDELKKLQENYELFTKGVYLKHRNHSKLFFPHASKEHVYCKTKDSQSVTMLGMFFIALSNIARKPMMPCVIHCWVSCKTVPIIFLKVLILKIN